MSRRIYALWIRPDDMVYLLRIHNNDSEHGFFAIPKITDARCVLTGNRVVIPNDAVVARCCYDIHRDAIGFHLQHHSFPETVDGQMFPSLSCTAITIDYKQLVNPAESPVDEPHPIVVKGGV